MSQDPDTWMWEKARELLERADKLQRSFFQIGRPRYQKPTWEPPTDIFETESELLVIVALPGVDPARVEVVIDSGTLTVAGERDMPPPCHKATVHRLEIPHGRFERSMTLPQGRFEIGPWELERGCLVLSLRKVKG